jgi:NAD(P)-dependent dehydrogenase (short-subunit alcohol dehydrogenase family)
MAAKKRALVTGASRGIGRITALELAKKGFDLTLLARDKGRGEAVANETRALGADTELLRADLSSLNEVERAAKEFLAKHDALDVLVNNAGALFMERRTTVDGFEMTFATNHLAYFLLTNLLRPALEKAAPARVVVVASTAHRGRTVPWDDFQHEKSYSGMTVYGESKLLNILFARELAKRLEKTGVTSNSLHPGFVASNFGRDNKGLIGWLMPVFQLFAISEEEGAKTTVWAATAPELEKVTGKYFDKCREASPTSEAQSDASAARLWKLSEELVAKAGVKL